MQQCSHDEAAAWTRLRCSRTRAQKREWSWDADGLRTYAPGQFEALCRTSCGHTRTGVSESSVGEAASGGGAVLSGLMVVVCGLDGLESISGSELDSAEWAANAVGRRLQT